jgi:metal-responsive CopG/Arc/MetJ family transcriptional regulator
MNSEQINFYLPKELLEKADNHCKKIYKKRSVWIRELIVKELELNNMKISIPSKEEWDKQQANQ